MSGIRSTSRAALSAASPRAPCVSLIRKGAPAAVPIRISPVACAGSSASAREIARAVGDPGERRAGFYLRRRQIFRGRPIRFGGYGSKRLLKLFMLEDISEEALREEASDLKRQREQLEDRLQTLRRTRSDAREPVDAALLRLIGQAIEAWLENGDAEQWTLVLEALQVTVEATRQRVILRGILPSEVPKFITTGRTSA